MKWAVAVSGIVLALLASAESASSGNSAKQFDLLCKGNQRVSEGGPIFHRASFETVFHIDLNDGAFCYDTCRGTKTLTSWNGHEIRYAFDFNKQKNPDWEYWPMVQVDRFTVNLDTMKIQRHYDYVTCYECTAAQLHHERASGICHKAPFTGFALRSD